MVGSLVYLVHLKSYHKLVDEVIRYWGSPTQKAIMLGDGLEIDHTII